MIFFLFFGIVSPSSTHSTEEITSPSFPSSPTSGRRQADNFWSAAAALKLSLTASMILCMTCRSADASHLAQHALVSSALPPPLPPPPRGQQVRHDLLLLLRQRRCQGQPRCGWTLHSFPVTELLQISTKKITRLSSRW